MTVALAEVGRVYDRTAPHYLALTKYDNYAVWTSAVDRLIRFAMPPGNRLLDVGCGAGRSSRHLADLDWTVTGIDASAEMIGLARHGSGEIDFHVHDARRPFGTAPFDVVNCMSDVVNYQTTQADLAALFGSAAQCLRPGGILAFDVNTLSNYERAEATDTVLETPQELLIWRTRRATSRVEGWRLTLDVFSSLDGAGWSRETVVHEQTRHTLDDLERTLRGAGLEAVATWTLTQRGRVDTDGGTDSTSATKLLIAARRSVERN